MSKFGDVTMTLNIGSGYFVKQVEAAAKALTLFKDSLVDLQTNHCHKCGERLSDIIDDSGVRYCSSCAEWHEPNKVVDGV